MIRFLSMLAAVIGLMLAPAAQAYSWHTHQAIARTAWLNVKPATRTAMARLIAQARLLETPECRANTLDDMSTWADCIRRYGPRFSYTANWHYQNVDVCKPFDLESACANGNCVSAQVARNFELLKDRKLPVRERVMALAFLIHFVGDLHQPLHAGDHGDAGGNAIKAAYGIYAPERLNLHTIWDNQLAERSMSTPPVPMRVWGAEERAAMSAGTVEDWSRDAWQAARDVTYASATGGDPCAPMPARVRLDDATVERLVPVQKLQIERAGLRLARLLDEALS